MRTQAGELLRSSILYHAAALLLAGLTAALGASGFEWGETLAGWALVTALTLWLYSAWLSWRARGHGDRSRWWKVIPFLALVELSAAIFGLSLYLAYDPFFAAAGDTLIGSGVPCLFPLVTVLLGAKWARRKDPRRVIARKQREMFRAVREAVALQCAALGLAAASFVLCSYAENKTALVFCVNLATAALVIVVWSGVRAVRTIELGARAWAAWIVFFAAVLEVNAFVIGVYAAYCQQGLLPGALQIVVESCLPVLIPVLTVSGFLAWLVYAGLQRVARHYGKALGLRWSAGLYASIFLICAPVPLFVYCAIERNSRTPTYDWVVNGSPNVVRDKGILVLSCFPQYRPIIVDLMCRQCCSVDALILAISTHQLFAEDAFEALSEYHPAEAYNLARRMAMDRQASQCVRFIAPYFALRVTDAHARQVLSAGRNYNFLDALAVHLVAAGRLELGAEIRAYLGRRKQHRKELLHQIQSSLHNDVRQNVLAAYLFENDDEFLIPRRDCIDYLGRGTRGFELRVAIRSAYALGDRPLTIKLLSYEMQFDSGDPSDSRQMWCRWLLQHLDVDDLQMKQWVAMRLCEVLGGLEIRSPFEWKAEDTTQIAAEAQKIREQACTWLRTAEAEPEQTVRRIQSPPTDE